jgi:hypothetical protein
MVPRVALNSWDPPVPVAGTTGGSQLSLLKAASFLIGKIHYGLLDPSAFYGHLGWVQIFLGCWDSDLGPWTPGKCSTTELHPQPLVFWDRVSLHSLGWPGTLSPPVFASRVLGLQVCTTTPRWLNAILSYSRLSIPNPKVQNAPEIKAFWVLTWSRKSDSLLYISFVSHTNY